MSHGPLAGFLSAHPAMTLFLFAAAFLVLARTVFANALRRSAVGVSTRFEALERSVDQLRAAIPETFPKAAPAGLRGENRARAMAMIEKGAIVELVASKIGVPVSDLELLMKVLRILARRSV